MTSSSDDSISVEVVYSLPDRHVSVAVKLDPGSTVADALARCGIEALVEGLDLGRSVVGVFGEVVERDRVLAAGDRVEIYRPLTMDPKEARRRRARDQRGRG